MEEVQFVLSIIIAIWAAVMFLSALFVYTNTDIVVTVLLFLICYGAIVLVKISYKELKSDRQ